MPFIEQMLFGVTKKDSNPGRAVLGHSPGMGKETTDEIVRLIENWGTTPPLGLEHPVMILFGYAQSFIHHFHKGLRAVHPHLDPHLSV